MCDLSFRDIGVNNYCKEGSCMPISRVPLREEVRASPRRRAVRPVFVFAFQTNVLRGSRRLINMSQMQAVKPLNQTEGNSSIYALKELKPGPWRSLGRVLDYSTWAERQRFLELDYAIAQINSLRSGSERETEYEWN